MYADIRRQKYIQSDRREITGKRYHSLEKSWEFSSFADFCYGRAMSVMYLVGDTLSYNPYTFYPTVFSSMESMHCVKKKVICVTFTSSKAPFNCVRHLWQVFQVVYISLLWSGFHNHVNCIEIMTNIERVVEKSRASEWAVWCSGVCVWSGGESTHPNDVTHHNTSLTYFDWCWRAH